MHIPAHFAEDLDGLLSFAKEEYKKVSIDIPSLQAGYLKTYLWLSSVLFAAEVAVFRSILNGDTGLALLSGRAGTGFYLSALAALCLALVVFALGIDRMRNRRPYRFPVEDFVRVGELALQASGEYAPLEARRTLLVNIQRAITDQTAEMHQKGSVLRRMSYCLLLSAACAIWATVAFVAA